jgi:hypothetical protein
MANSPIGINFMPSEENQQMGPKRGNLEGDLGQAFKILSLRLPRVLGARSLSPHVAQGPGAAAGMPGGFNPQAAIFEALLKSMAGGGGMPGMSPMGGSPGVNFIPGDDMRQPKLPSTDRLGIEPTERRAFDPTGGAFAPPDRGMRRGPFTREY